MRGCFDDKGLAQGDCVEVLGPLVADSAAVNWCHADIPGGVEFKSEESNSQGRIQEHLERVSCPKLFTFHVGARNYEHRDRIEKGAEEKLFGSFEKWLRKGRDVPIKIFQFHERSVQPVFDRRAHQASGHELNVPKEVKNWNFLPNIIL